MNPIVASIEACETATEVFDGLNRFFAWLRKTRSDFFAFGPLPIQSARELVAWKSAVRAAAKGRQRARRTLDDLSYIDEALNAAWRRLESLHQS